MSQFFIATTSGNLPPSVPTSFSTDNGTATPAANILEVMAIDVTDNNVNGIQVEGGLVQTGAANRVQVQLTNRISGTATTTDGVTPQTVYSFPLGATPGTYLLSVRIVGFNVTDSLSASYSSFRNVRTTGVAAVTVGATTAFVDEEGAMTGVLVANGVSGNNATVTVTGLAEKTINWLALTEYIFIS